MPAYATLAVITAPVKEVVTLDQAKKHLRVDNNDDDDLIQILMAAARDYAQDYTGTSFITQQLEYCISQKPFTGAYPFVSLPFPITIYPLWYPWPNVMNYPTDLPRRPLQSVDNVGYGIWGQTDQQLDPSEYDADLRLGRVNFHAGAIPGGQDYLLFRFTCGYGPDGSYVPGSIVAGVLAILAHLYENRGDTDGEIPTFAKRLLGMNRLVTFGG
jgi:hypothetical protein